MIRKVFMEQTLHIKNLKIKKGELILRLSRPEKAIQLQASIVFQNTGFQFFTSCRTVDRQFIRNGTKD